MPDVVYPLISAAEGFAQWWAADITQAEGAVDLGFFNRATIYRLRLTTAQPPVQADWLCETGDEWIGTHIVFRLEAKGSGTVLRFSHAGWPGASDYFVNCNTTWGELTFRIKSTAEGKPRGPLFLASDLAY